MLMDYYACLNLNDMACTAVVNIKINYTSWILVELIECCIALLLSICIQSPGFCYLLGPLTSAAIKLSITKQYQYPKPNLRP